MNLALRINMILVRRILQFDKINSSLIIRIFLIHLDSCSRIKKIRALAKNSSKTIDMNYST